MVNIIQQIHSMPSAHVYMCGLVPMHVSSFIILHVSKVTGIQLLHRYLNDPTGI